MPSVAPGPVQITVTNPSGESHMLDNAFASQQWQSTLLRSSAGSGWAKKHGAGPGGLLGTGEKAGRIGLSEAEVHLSNSLPLESAKNQPILMKCANCSLQRRLRGGEREGFEPAVKRKLK